MATTKEPPLVDVKVTNPVTYLRRWWDKVMGKEGIDFSFRIHPITAILIVFVISAVAFGAGRFSINIPFLNYEVINSSTPVASVIWKETAYIGTLKYSMVTRKYFLVTSSSAEAITLQVPTNVELKDLIEKRVFVIGSYNKSTKTLVVADMKNMEVLSKTPIPIPTIEVTSTPEILTLTPEPIPQNVLDVE